MLESYVNEHAQCSQLHLYKKAGRARLGYLKPSSIISFSSEHVIKVSELQEEVEELQQDLSELQHDFTLAIEELADSQEAIEHMRCFSNGER